MNLSGRFSFYNPKRSNDFIYFNIEIDDSESKSDSTQ